MINNPQFASAVPTHLLKKKVLIVTANETKYNTEVCRVSKTCIWFKDLSTGKKVSMGLKIWNDFNMPSTVLGPNIRLPYWVKLVWIEDND